MRLLNADTGIKIMIDLSSALQKLPQVLQAPLTEWVLAPEFDASLSAEQFKQLMQVSQLTDAQLRLALLPLAAAYAHVPISKFYVGAIVRGLSGRLYFGANMEWTGLQMGQTIHAEQAAISHAWMKGEQGLIDVTVNYSPCGHCRQFMNELTSAKQLMIQLPDRKPRSLHEYLPDSFGPKDLNITTALMDAVNHHQTSSDSDPLIQQALIALNKSHAPYSHNLSGVALLTQNQGCFLGAYAENAAFNPSLPPLQVALVQLRMAQIAFEHITHAALVEIKDATVSHLADTQATLDALDPDIEFSYLAL